jgi:hypothetical protein
MFTWRGVALAATIGSPPLILKSAGSGGGQPLKMEIGKKVEGDYAIIPFHFRDGHILLL